MQRLDYSYHYETRDCMPTSRGPLAFCGHTVLTGFKAHYHDAYVC